MGRKPLGGEGVETRMVPMRWSTELLARVDEARGKQDRSSFAREAVERELERRERGQGSEVRSEPSPVNETGK